MAEIKIVPYSTLLWSLHVTMQSNQMYCSAVAEFTRLRTLCSMAVFISKARLKAMIQFRTYMSSFWELVQKDLCKRMDGSLCWYLSLWVCVCVCARHAAMRVCMSVYPCVRAPVCVCARPCVCGYVWNKSIWRVKCRSPNPWVTVSPLHAHALLPSLEGPWIKHQSTQELCT